MQRIRHLELHTGIDNYKKDEKATSSEDVATKGSKDESETTAKDDEVKLVEAGQVHGQQEHSREEHDEEWIEEPWKLTNFLNKPCEER